MTWLIENWELIVAALLGLHALASAITAMTPTPKDDEFVATVYRQLERLALVIGKAKDR